MAALVSSVQNEANVNGLPCAIPTTSVQTPSPAIEIINAGTKEASSSLSKPVKILHKSDLLYIASLVSLYLNPAAFLVAVGTGLAASSICLVFCLNFDKDTVIRKFVHNTNVVLFNFGGHISAVGNTLLLWNNFLLESGIASAAKVAFNAKALYFINGFSLGARINYLILGCIIKNSK
ncbi:MAG: hypothetical protein WC222_02705 [Parachlamydiales bacterium]|jgi:hypothetical protein